MKKYNFYDMYHVLQNAVVQEIITLIRSTKKTAVQIDCTVTITGDDLEDVDIMYVKANRNKLEFYPAYPAEQMLPFYAEDMTFSSLVDIYETIYNLIVK